jgi:hypothetical protein
MEFVVPYQELLYYELLFDTMAAPPFTYPSVRQYNKGMKKTEHILVISGRGKRKRGAETKRAKRACSQKQQHGRDVCAPKTEETK